MIPAGPHAAAADHDDDAGDDLRHAPAGAGDRAGRRDARADGARGRRRADHLDAADTDRRAGRLLRCSTTSPWRSDGAGREASSTKESTSRSPRQQPQPAAGTARGVIATVVAVVALIIAPSCRGRFPCHRHPADRRCRRRGPSAHDRARPVDRGAQEPRSAEGTRVPEVGARQVPGRARRRAAAPRCGCGGGRRTGTTCTSCSSATSIRQTSERYPANFRVSQVVFAWGKVGAAIRGAKEGIASADDQLEIYRQAAVRDVTTAAFYDVLLAKRARVDRIRARWRSANVTSPRPGVASSSAWPPITTSCQRRSSGRQRAAGRHPRRRTRPHRATSACASSSASPS